MSTKQKYRTEGRAVYMLDTSKEAYVFVGWLKGRTLAQFIVEYEAEQESADDTYYDDTY